MNGNLISLKKKKDSKLYHLSDQYGGGRKE
jgi:hypothetical protein